MKHPPLASEQPARELATGDGDGVVSGEAEEAEIATTEGQSQSTDTTNGVIGSGLGHASTEKTSGQDGVRSPGAPTSSAGSPDMGASLRAGIARVVNYPAQARRRGWQGTTRLRIASDPAKRTVDVSVVTSSGFECLDDAALRATRAALESLRLRAPVAMTLPVEFRLR